MLRQSEDEPEDVLGEILINIGLAAPGDTRPLTPSSSTSSSRCSPAPAEPDAVKNTPYPMQDVPPQGGGRLGNISIVSYWVIQHSEKSFSEFCVH